MKAPRFLPPRKEAADETKASHEVMELVRQDHKLGLLVIRLREAGRSWCDVKTRIEAEKGPAAPKPQQRPRARRAD